MGEFMDSVTARAARRDDLSAADTPPALDVVLAHEDFFIIDKPPGMTVQRDETHGDGVLEALRQQFKAPVWPVHRLDAGTSGLLLVARTEAGNRELSRLFREHRVEKAYLAVSQRTPSRKQGWVKGDMLPARRGAWKLATTHDHPAVTRFFSKGLGGSRLFLVLPQTGKTHQIRVALKSLGSPIIGDRLYGGPEAGRLCLHAAGLRFPWGAGVVEAWRWPDTGGDFGPLSDPEVQAWVRDASAAVQGPAVILAP
jgi:tRNA pseudouridine32 synthase/23S rRNA pseudouridine746 synthase